MSECTHDCSTCQNKCSSAKPESLLAPQNAGSNVKKVIGIVSGKGGVGKSLVTGLLATLTARNGHTTAILDADITGPSIPKAFGLSAVEGFDGDENGLIPPTSTGGVDIMSVNLLLEDETRPVVWRGPVIAGTVKQFWTDVVWDEVDYMFVDMPPGTGDVSLPVFQNLPVDGIIIVTTPQDLVTMIVKKAFNMAKLMNIPVLGLVENMSYAVCPDCGKRINIYGDSHILEIAQGFGYDVLGQIPLDAKLASLCDNGKIEELDSDYLDIAATVIEHRLGLGE